MNKEVVVIICPDVLKKPYFYEAIKKRNYDIAVVAKGYKGDKADYILNIDYKNLDIVVSELVKFREKHKIAMIFSVSEFGIEVAAAAAEILGIPYGSSYAAVKRARNKYLTRQFLREKNVATPNFGIAKNNQEIKKMIKKIGLPVIIKPLNGAGACSVIQINSIDEIEEKLENVIANRGKMPVNDYRIDTTQEYWIVEEYLDGIEISVECCTFEGETKVIAIHDKYCDVCEPYFIEKTFVTPSPRFTTEQIIEIECMAKEVLSAIGYDYGVAHVEMKVTSNGPRLLEINARVGGGLNMESVLYSTGINILELLLDIRRGIKPNINITHRNNVAFTMIPVVEGIVKKISGFEEALEVDHISLAQPYLEVGEEVKARQANYGGFILAKDGDTSTLLEKLKVAEQKVEFEIEKV